MLALRISALVLAVTVSAPVAASTASVEQGVLAEINFARTQPQAYARQRLAEGVRYERGGRQDAVFADDPDAVAEAFEAMMRQRPLPPLGWDDRLARAAIDHVREQGPRGDVGHGRGGDSPAERMHRAGLWAGMTAENISYGYARPRDVVLQLVIDSGVATRGHRKTILSGALQRAGVACGGHDAWGAMCVIDFAGAVVER